MRQTPRTIFLIVQAVGQKYLLKWPAHQIANNLCMG